MEYVVQVTLRGRKPTQEEAIQFAEQIRRSMAHLLIFGTVEVISPETGRAIYYGDLGISPRLG